MEKEKGCFLDLSFCSSSLSRKCKIKCYKKIRNQHNIVKQFSSNLKKKDTQGKTKKACIPHTFKCEGLTPNVMVFEGRAFERWLDHEGGALVNEISAPESSLCSSAMWGQSEKNSLLVIIVSLLLAFNNITIYFIHTSTLEIKQTGLPLSERLCTHFPPSSFISFYISTWAILFQCVFYLCILGRMLKW